MSTSDATYLKEARLRLARNKERDITDRTMLIPLLDGAERLIGDLSQEIATMETSAERLEKIGGYETQVRECRRLTSEIATIRDRAKTVYTKLAQAEMTSLPAPELQRFFLTEIQPIMVDEMQRRARALRVQGLPLASPTQVEDGVGGLHAEAIVRFARYLQELFMNPNSHVQELWHWCAIGDEESIWLYRHHPEKKWECLYFRIQISQLGSSLEFRLEIFVPYGFGNDPAPYRLESSDVYVRSDWQIRSVYSHTVSTNNTVSLSVSESYSEGDSLGYGTSTQESVTTGTQQSQTSGTSTGYSNTRGSSGGWFEGWNNSSSSNFGNNFSSSYGSSSGTSGGTSGGWSISDGTSSSTSDSTTTGTSTGTTTGTGTSENATHTTGFATTLTNGITIGGGESLQVRSVAFGIAHDASNEDLLQRWSRGNYEAARILKRVENVFSSAVTHVAGELREMQRGRQGRPPDTRGIRDRLDELEKLILVEHLPQIPADVRSSAPPKAIERKGPAA